MALGNLLDTAEGRAELRELISAVRQEDPDGEAARYRRLRQALRELLASQAPELRLLEAAAAVLPAEKQNRLADARAIWMKELWSYLIHLFRDPESYAKKLRKAADPAEFEALTAGMFRELELLPDEGEE